MKPGSTNPSRGSFGSKFGIIAATAGSAIGLGNIWRFPYVAGENGGAAFLIVYLLFILAIGIPVMLSEFTIGRNARRNPFGAFKKLSPGRPWWLVGVMGIVAAFTILAFYSVVAGWTMEYLYSSLLDKFAGKSTTEIEHAFEGFVASGARPIMWLLIFIVLSALIVVAGIEKGIEKYTKLLMPVLLVIIIILCVRAVTLEGAGEGLAFLFKPDFSKLTASTILEALGQAFFSLSIGMGTLITYGSYIQKRDNLGSTALSVATADTLIAILAGVAIFPAVFAFGISPNSGPELVFITLPNIFEQMPAGYYFSILFFTLLVVAAVTSSISILEVVVAYFVEELKISRKVATILAASGAAMLGILCSLSQGVMPELQLFGKNLFDLLDFTSSNILLPLGGFFIVLFAAWFFGKKKLFGELSSQGHYSCWYYKLYLFIVRFVAPVAIALVFLNGMGWL